MCLPAAWAGDAEVVIGRDAGALPASSAVSDCDGFADVVKVRAIFHSIGEFTRKEEFVESRHLR
jgi:hypothetical protein